MHHRRRDELPLTGTKGKIPVIGAISCKGNVVCKTIENTDIPMLNSFVRQAANPRGVNPLATHEHSGCHLLDHDYNHRIVRHAQPEYVVGTTHTKSIESFRSLQKCEMMGGYQKVSKEYLPLYLNEFQFRFNNRRTPDIFDLRLSGC